MINLADILFISATSAMFNFKLAITMWLILVASNFITAIIREL